MSSGVMNPCATQPAAGGFFLDLVPHAGGVWHAIFNKSYALKRDRTAAKSRLETAPYAANSKKFPPAAGP